MDLLQAMKERHSVRSYANRPIERETKENLQNYIEECSKESGLHLQLVLDEPNAFDSFMAHYGKFSGVRNYILLAGKKNADLEERCGYYGEKIVLFAQMLGLNTCWGRHDLQKRSGKASTEPRRKAVSGNRSRLRAFQRSAPQIQTRRKRHECTGNSAGLVSERN